MTFPVDPTQQTAQLNFSLVQNTGTTQSPAFWTTLRTSLYPVDLENDSVQPPVWQNYSAGGLTESFAAHWQVVPVVAKAPTWIYVPVGNATEFFDNGPGSVGVVLCAPGTGGATTDSPLARRN